MRRVLALALTAASVVTALVVGSAWLSSGARGASASARTPRTGVVVVDTTLGLVGTEAAGTGIVLTASGEVLTNNHVIRGATAVRVTTGSGRSYTARVAGYSVVKDVAVLRLERARGLSTALIGDSSRVKQWSPVTAVGNAGGTGTLTTVTGRVTDLGRVITVGDGLGNTSHLSDMIETSAPLQPGDSGGPLLFGGRVIGVDAAGQPGFHVSGTGTGFAIPIDTALAIANRIRSGRQSPSVHIGPTAFLGVGLEPGSAPAGAVVHDVVSGSPADRAGVEPGDVIVRIGSRKVVSRATVQNVLLQVEPGHVLRLSWNDRSGRTRDAIVRPVSGPPQ